MPISDINENVIKLSTNIDIEYTLSPRQSSLRHTVIIENMARAPGSSNIPEGRITLRIMLLVNVEKYKGRGLCISGAVTSKIG